MNRVLAAIRSMPWAIMPGYLEAIEAMAVRALDHPAVQSVADDGHVDRHYDAIAVMGERAPGTRMSALRNGIASVPIMGPILPRAALINPSGAGATALDHVAADIRALQASPDVKKILLVVDSPGGAVTGVHEFAGFLAQSQKPIYAHVSGLCASAAYWIVAGGEVKEITVDPTAIVGSIGIMLSSSVQEGPDQSGRREVAITSSNAPNKRPDLSTDEGIATVREMIDALEEIFIADVARGRGVTPAVVKAEFGAGGTKTGKAAKAAGMVDRVEAGGLDATLRRLAGPQSSATPRRTAAARSLEVAQLRASL